MVAFYRFFIALYTFAIRLAAWFKPKAKSFIEGRKNLLLHIKVDQSSENRPVIWMHCSSLGEFEQGRPVLEGLRQHYPGHAIVLTFFSPSGYQVRKKYKGADYVYYLPVDTASNARQFVRNIQPKLAVFVKYDLWYFYLSELRKQQVPVILIDAIFRPGQVFFKWYGSLHRKMLGLLSHIFVQTMASQRLLEGIGVKNVSVAGDTRFDRVFSVAQKARQIEEFERWKEEYRFVVAGSTWEEDERMLRTIVTQLPSQFRLVIAPHEVDAARISFIEKLFPGNTLRWSACTSHQILDKQVLIIDTIGLLLKIYRYGHIAWIGGGYGKAGVHNVLEAAVYGLPTAFGPNFGQYQEAVELVREGASFPCADSRDSARFLDTMLSDTAAYSAATKAAQSYVREKLGATPRILDYLAEKNWLSIL